MTNTGLLTFAELKGKYIPKRLRQQLEESKNMQVGEPIVWNQEGSQLLNFTFSSNPASVFFLLSPPH